MVNQIDTKQTEHAGFLLFFDSNGKFWSNLFSLVAAGSSVARQLGRGLLSLISREPRPRRNPRVVAGDLKQFLRNLWQGRGGPFA
jgi:hypothetical protein